MYRLPLALRLVPVAALVLACRSKGTTNYVVDADGDGVPSDTDCNDNDPSVGAAQTYYVDADGDTYGDPTKVDAMCSLTAGYSANADDCDDTNAAINPGATEVCNGVDDDCDGVVDNGMASATYYTDADSDGYGDDSTAVVACTQPDGTVTQGGDCNDTDPAYNPGASETDCSDPNDYNCDGSVGYADGDGDGFPACQDCNDADGAINPDATEVCDGVDNDCDTLVDDADPSLDTSTASQFYADLDGDGYGDPGSPANMCNAGAGWVVDNTDCDDGRADVNPAATEVCDGIDNDCDTLVDDADPSLDTSTGSTYYTDADGDGYGDDSTSVMACEAPAGTVSVGGDCNDADTAYNPGASEADCTDPNDYNCDGSVGYADADGDGWAACQECDDSNANNYPGAPEYCDGVDNNCDGTVDENTAVDAATWYADADSDTFGDASSSTASCSQPPGNVSDATDCDDANAAVNPAETEVCNGIDDNCNGVVDEATSADAPTWYGDGDGDGYGNPSDDTVSCAQPAGTVSNATDCNDGNASIYPGAPEYCNGVDDNCNGAVDEDSAVDVSTWYGDGDSDGYGAGTGILDCDQPSGYVGNADDCNDADGAINPAAAEVCDGVDNNCNDAIDEGLATNWYADADSDTFGDAGSSLSQCDQPAGYVSDSTDCNDGDPDVNPAAAEVCNGIDDNCDGNVDEGVLSTFYADADTDGYGNPDVSSEACAQPAGTVTDNTDCNDADANIHPGAPERDNGIDDDCNGQIDDGAYHGTGADGALDVTGTTTIGDAVVVTVISGATLTVSGAPGVSAGDEVLVINMHGSDTSHDHVGNYQFLWVSSVSGGDVVLDSAPTVTFGQLTNDDLSEQAVQMVRVPQYTDVTVESGGVLTAPVWNGATGGVLAFRATGAVTVQSGGLIEADEAGYAAGQTGTAYNDDAYQGESYAGAGDGNTTSSCSGYYCNEPYGYYAANYGGGGAIITGGGGNYGGGATAGDSWYAAYYHAPEAGLTYGTTDLSMLFPGSGGGGVWHGSESDGPGGTGAGIVYVAAESIAATDAASFSAIGGTTTSWSHGSWHYGAGGGAGGSVWLVANTLSLPADGVDAIGGLGEHTPGGEGVAASDYRAGGDGGYGRIRLDYNTINGVASTDVTASATVAAVCDPDAGYSATP